MLISAISYSYGLTPAFSILFFLLFDFSKNNFSASFISQSIQNQETKGEKTFKSKKITKKGNTVTAASNQNPPFPIALLNKFKKSNHF
jgi:hypothetical protein